MSIVIWPACRVDSVSLEEDDRPSARLGPWRLEPTIRGAVHVLSGRRVLLSNAMFRYAYLLATNPNRPLRWQVMFTYATGRRYGEYNNNVRTTIKHLRKRLDMPPTDFIIARHDFGYEYVP